MDRMRSRETRNRQPCTLYMPLEVKYTYGFSDLLRRRINLDFSVNGRHCTYCARPFLRNRCYSKIDICAAESNFTASQATGSIYTFGIPERDNRNTGAGIRQRPCPVSSSAIRDDGQRGSVGGLMLTEWDRGNIAWWRRLLPAMRHERMNNRPL